MQEIKRDRVGDQTRSSWNQAGSRPTALKGGWIQGWDQGIGIKGVVPGFESRGLEPKGLHPTFGIKGVGTKGGGIKGVGIKQSRSGIAHHFTLSCFGR